MSRHKKTQTGELELTIMQQAFVSLWTGNIKETAALVPMDYGYARKLATRDDIRKAIAQRHLRETSPEIASRQQRQRFWSNVMNDTEQDMQDRLRASELLGRSEADFTDNVKVKSPILEEIATERRLQAQRIAGLLQAQYETSQKPLLKPVESEVIENSPDSDGQEEVVSPEP